MNNQLNELIGLMNEAREQSDVLNNVAYTLRQEAIRAQFAATAAAETATLAAELLSKCNDPAIYEELAHSSRQALRNTITATEAAANAVEKANEADRRVTEAFTRCRDAAHELTMALDQMEGLRGALQRAE